MMEWLSFYQQFSDFPPSAFLAHLKASWEDLPVLVDIEMYLM